METYSIKETVRAFISGDMAIVLYPEQTIKP